MPKFDKRFVYFMWDDTLQGKTVFFADYIPHLQRKVENNDIEHYTKVTQSDGLLPFMMKDGRAAWQFVYFDPNYELKRAHEQGKKIECKRKGDAWGDLDWDYTPAPEWRDDHEYRIMPEEQKPVTNRELALWLAQGNGEIYLYDDSGFKTEVKTSYGYHQEYENCDCNEDKTLYCKIRKWGDTEWVTPTRQYMGLEE